jgi:hypothetical protein
MSKLARRVGVFAGAVAIALATTLAVAAPASAGEKPSSLKPVATEQVPSLDYVPYLEALAPIQTEEEIETVMASDGPVELLVDSATGDVLAALAPDDLMVPFALSPLGPGCSTVSPCMARSGGISYGYIGTGTLNGSWSPIFQVKTGDRAGAFTWNGIRNAYPAQRTVNLTSTVTITKIERS